MVDTFFAQAHGAEHYIQCGLGLCGGSSSHLGYIVTCSLNFKALIRLFGFY